ncbi:hypothetical protein TcasGA2_TC034959, partial [Tribolium castaneum]
RYLSLVMCRSILPVSFFSTFSATSTRCKQAQAMAESQSPYQRPQLEEAAATLETLEKVHQEFHTTHRRS